MNPKKVIIKTHDELLELMKTGWIEEYQLLGDDVSLALPLEFSFNHENKSFTINQIDEERDVKNHIKELDECYLKQEKTSNSFSRWIDKHFFTIFFILITLILLSGLIDARG